MAKESEDLSVAAVATQRFNDLLGPLLEQGHTQAQIATKAGIPPQYFSDIKRGERPVTELIARRLGEEFNFKNKGQNFTIPGFNPLLGGKPSRISGALPSMPSTGQPSSQWAGTK